MTEEKRIFPGCRHFHFIGIGGIGMSGLAELMNHYGYTVSGSDRNLTPLTERLSDMGIAVYPGHDPEHQGLADVVVFSAAIAPDNPEILETRRRDALLISRADLLGALTRKRRTIAVAGTHGKTTTTAMIGQMLMEADMDPTLVIGGILPALDSNARAGRGDWLVVEADEYARSFHTLAPVSAVITSIDADHLEYFGSQEAIDEAFLTFAHLVPFHHPIIACLDDPGIQRVRSRIRRRLITYGVHEEADIRASVIHPDGFGLTARVTINGHDAGTLRLQRPGRHHAVNALAALGVAHMLDIPVETAFQALGRFTGVKRRFEIKGQINGITVIDDYAHHPNEIRATLDAAAMADHRIVAVFQPHLYTRTRDLAEDFGRALAESGLYRVIVTDVYPSREKPIEGVTGDLIVRAAIRARSSTLCEYVADKTVLPSRLAAELRPGDTLLTMGAGDIDEIGEETLALLSGGSE